MRRLPTRLLPFVLAFALGVGAAVLTACGGSSSKALIPAANADQLKAHLANVSDAIASGKCDRISAMLSQLDSDIQQLPDHVSVRLVAKLKEGVLRLRSQAPRACAQNTVTTATTQTQTLTTVTTTPPVTTATTPTTTTPTTTTPTTTPTTPTTSTSTSDTGGVEVVTQ